MAACAWKARHRRIRGTDMASGALPDHASSFGVTLVAAQFRVLTQQRPGVFEFFSHGYVTGFRDRCLLRNYRMAKWAVLPDHFAVRADMIAFMATKTAWI